MGMCVWRWVLVPLPGGLASKGRLFVSHLIKERAYTTKQRVGPLACAAGGDTGFFVCLHWSPHAHHAPHVVLK